MATPTGNYQIILHTTRNRKSSTSLKNPSENTSFCTTQITHPAQSQSSSTSVSNVTKKTSLDLEPLSKDTTSLEALANSHKDMHLHQRTIKVVR